MSDIERIDEMEPLEDKDLVIVQWVKVNEPKNAEISQGWECIDDDNDEEEIENENITQCISIGYVVKDTKFFIKVAPHIMGDEDGLSYSGAIAIPKSSIVESRILAGLGEDKEDSGE